MNELPAPVRPALRRLARRLALGLFLDAWPAWIVATLLASGVVVLVCRLFFPAAAPRLPWIWVAPIFTVVPAALLAARRAYRPRDVVALADSLSGGHGLLLTLADTEDSAWADERRLEQAARFPLPRLRPWRTLAPIGPAIVFLVLAFWLPQRTAAAGSNAIVAEEIASELAATVEELKQQALVTPAEEEKLDEAIERIRRAAEERVDASSWEAADAFRERLAAEVAAKEDAVKWAEASLARFEAAGRSGEPAGPEIAELTAALQKLSDSGLLGKASPELQRLLKGGRLPSDPAALRELAASLGKELAAARGRFGELAKLGKEFGRFDPAEFPIASEITPDGDGEPGTGGINRGRADAPLTWGNESQPIDRFKATPLPEGAGRPDDWTPVVELPGAPEPSPVLSTPAAARAYAASAGQTAWRRTLSPRHQSAVKKYFAK